MNRRSLRPLVLCVVCLLLTSGVLSQKPKSSGNQIKSERLNQKELNQLAVQLAENDLQEYTLRVYSSDPRSDAKLARATSVRGLFLMRNPEFLKKLPSGAFDDKQGNLIFIGNFPGTPKHNTSFSLTLTAFGDAILAFDLNGDGVVDQVIGKRSKGEIWELENALSPFARECLESHRQTGAFDAAFSCWGNKDSTGKPGKSGPGAGVGERHPLDEFLDSMSNPNCDPNPRDVLTDVPPNAPTETLGDVITLDVNAELSHNASERAYDKHNDQLGDDLHRATEHGEAAARAAVESRTASTPEERARAYDRYRTERDAYLREISNARSHGDRTVYLPLHEPLPKPPNRRPVGPDESKDPRCTSLETEIKQGLWFMNPRFCTGHDFLNCFMRSADAIRDATQGKCRTETGPDDSQTLVCEKTEDPLNPPAEDRVSSAVDGPVNTVNLGPRQKVNYSYVSTIPLGAMIVVRCQTVGCRMDGSERKIQ